VAEQGARVSDLQNESSQKLNISHQTTIKRVGRRKGGKVSVSRKVARTKNEPTENKVIINLEFKTLEDS